MTSGRLPIIRTPMGSKKNSEKIGRNPYLNSRSTFSNRRKEMAANIGSQPWLTRPLSPQPHTRQKRRACDFYLSVFDSTSASPTPFPTSTPRGASASYTSPISPFSKSYQQHASILHAFSPARPSNASDLQRTCERQAYHTVSAHSLR